jgi:hypothetical protein
MKAGCAMRKITRDTENSVVIRADSWVPAAIVGGAFITIGLIVAGALVFSAEYFAWPDLWLPLIPLAGGLFLLEFWCSSDRIDFDHSSGRAAIGPVKGISRHWHPTTVTAHEAGQAWIDKVKGASASFSSSGGIAAEWKAYNVRLPAGHETLTAITTGDSVLADYVITRLHQFASTGSPSTPSDRR